MKTLIYHITGNANVKAAVYGLQQANMLDEFHVTIAAFPGTVLDRLGSISAFSEIRRRRFDPVLRPFTRRWPWLEAGRLIAPKIGILKNTCGKNGPFYIDTVVQRHDRHVASCLKYAAKRGASAVYGYEDASIFSFQEAKRLGLQCFYDLPIGYWRAAHRILKLEQERLPQWATTLTAFEDSKEKLLRKDRELELADKIFVASSFTANTLKEFPGNLAPVHVIPYGFPAVSKEQKTYRSFHRKRSLKILFIGSLSQRKGIAHLFEAVKQLKDFVKLTVVGKKQGNHCAALDAALREHVWLPSLSNEAILNLMQQHDVLAFPSLFEGFGLVISEAMSQGTPVITTDRTAGPDLMTDGHNGWLIRAGCTEALTEAFARLLDHPEEIAMVGKAAMETARCRPWTKYGRELAHAIGGGSYQLHREMAVIHTPG